MHNKRMGVGRMSVGTMNRRVALGKAGGLLLLLLECDSFPDVTSFKSISTLPSYHIQTHDLLSSFRTFIYSFSFSSVDEISSS